MFFGSGERLVGAKNWTKWPSDTWRTKAVTAAPDETTPPSCLLEPTGSPYLQLPGVAFPVHVVRHGEGAINGAVGAVGALPLLLQGGLEDHVSLSDRDKDVFLIPFCVYVWILLKTRSSQGIFRPQIQLKNFQTSSRRLQPLRPSKPSHAPVRSHLVLGGRHSDQAFKLVAQAVGRLHPGDAVGLVDVDVHLQGEVARRRQRRTHTHSSLFSY